MSKNMPYWRLSSFYLFYFASLGALVPYWGLYLQSLGLSAADIGLLVGLIMATKIVSPNIWGWIADHTGRRMAIVRWGCLMGAVCFAGVLISQAYWWLVVVMLSFSFFWNATLPQFEATTFDHLGEHAHRYSGIRLWGSVGFIITVAVIGWALEMVGVQALPGIVALLMLVIWLSSLWVPEGAAGHLELDHEPLSRVLRRPVVLALLVVCFLMQMSHGAYYTFYSIYLDNHGYSRTLIGQLWALGVLAEVGIFLVMHYLVPRLGLARLLLIALALTALRWVLIGAFVDVLWIVFFAQLLHAASFGIYHGSAIQLIHRFFVGRHQGKGQALYSSLSFGAGGAIGSIYSGYAWESLGPMVTFNSSAAVAVLAFIVAWIWIRPRVEAF